MHLTSLPGVIIEVHGTSPDRQPYLEHDFNEQGHWGKCDFEATPDERFTVLIRTTDELKLESDCLRYELRIDGQDIDQGAFAGSKSKEVLINGVYVFTKSSTFHRPLVFRRARLDDTEVEELSDEQLHQVGQVELLVRHATLHHYRSVVTESTYDFLPVSFHDDAAAPEEPVKFDEQKVKKGKDLRCCTRFDFASQSDWTPPKIGEVRNGSYSIGDEKKRAYTFLFNYGFKLEEGNPPCQEPGFGRNAADQSDDVIFVHEHKISKRKQIHLAIDLEPEDSKKQKKRKLAGPSDLSGQQVDGGGHFQDQPIKSEVEGQW
ncbi:hypothetical protein KVT40_002813 [Elsinoe batatas]|uniref:DUF7918 domain-containing protein n=1 Tax=Elsinoe batatas TaxID=2601811 RepID=A0A8K0PIX5_9PEZI|nr:hypothetical protein KVT40_002813 [Elsinoe batatas]